MKIVNGKLKEISAFEYDDIKAITRMMSCYKDGEDMTLEYLGLENNPANRRIAWNVLMAVMNDYKYFKVKEVD